MDLEMHLLWVVEIDSRVGPSARGSASCLWCAHRAVCWSHCMFLTPCNGQDRKHAEHFQSDWGRVPHRAFLLLCVLAPIGPRTRLPAHGICRRVKPFIRVCK